MTEPNVSREQFNVTGGAVLDKVKELIHEGNVRRIIIKNAEGKSVLEIPVTVGVVGLVIAPVAAAIGTIAVLAAEYSIEVERETGPSPDQSGTTDTPS
jgi:Domain of unknown function (DUF4342)